MASSVLSATLASPFTASSSGFTSYRLDIYDEPYTSQATDIRSKSEQQQLLNELKQRIELTHSYVQVSLKSGQQLPECYDDFFEVVEEKSKYGKLIYFLGPKITTESSVADTGKTRYIYASGVEEYSVILPDRSRRGVRRFPNTGIVEIGVFRDIPDPKSPRMLKQPFSGIRKTPEGNRYVCPQKWFDPANMSAHAYVDNRPGSNGQLVPTQRGSCLNFRLTPLYLVHSETDGEKLHLIPVVAPPNECRQVEYAECTRFTREELMCVMLQSEELYFPKQLKEAHQWIEVSTVLELLLTPSAQLQGSLPLHHIRAVYLPTIFAWADQLGVTIDLHAIDPNTGETLFSKHAKNGYALDLYRLMLDRDPTVIRQLQTLNHAETFLTVCLRKGREEAALLFIESARAQQIPLSLTDLWLLRVYENDLSFSNEEFGSLDEALKWDLFRLANEFGKCALIRRLRPLLPLETKEMFQGPSLLAPSMDYLRRCDVTRSRLCDLRNTGLLFFESQFKESFDRKQWVSKRTDVGRIFGALYSQSIIDRLGLTRIKVPKKIAVISDSLEEVSIDLSEGRGNGEVIGITSDNLNVYAKRIETTRSHATYEEMVELVSFVEAAGYADINDANFILSDDGIYLIDLEFANFDLYPHYEQWCRMIALCELGKRENFIEYVNAKLTHPRKPSKPDSAAKHSLKWMLKINGFSSRITPMKFQVISFMNPFEAKAKLLRIAFLRVKQADPSAVELRRRSILKFPHRMRRLIYKITADWGNQKGNLEWGKANYAQEQTELMGILTEALLIEFGKASKTMCMSEGALLKVRSQVAELPGALQDKLNPLFVLK